MKYVPRTARPASVTRRISSTGLSNSATLSGSFDFHCRSIFHPRCTECKNSKILTPSGTCDDDCPDGFYAHSSTEDDPTIGSLCVECPENCAKCTSPDHCTECKSATYLTDDHTCDLLCPDGFYGDGTADTGRVCKKCSDDCNRCASDDMCYECKNHKFLTPSDACEAECPEGYYADLSSETPSVGACLSVWQLVVVLAAPPKAKHSHSMFYAESVLACSGGGLCMPCPSGCAACDGPDSCTVCRDNKFLNSRSLRHASICMKQSKGVHISGVADVRCQTEASLVSIPRMSVLRSVQRATMGRLARKMAPMAPANPVLQNVQAVSAQMSAFLASMAPVSVISDRLALLGKPSQSKPKPYRGYKFSKSDRSCTSFCKTGFFKNEKGKCQNLGGLIRCLIVSNFRCSKHNLDPRSKMRSWM